MHKMGKVSSPQLEALNELKHDGDTADLENRQEIAAIVKELMPTRFTVRHILKLISIVGPPSSVITCFADLHVGAKQFSVSCQCSRHGDSIDP